MTEQKICPQCGKQLAADAPAGLCPECLLKQGLDSGTGSESLENTAAMSGFIPPDPEELDEKFPQLEILELIGKGGMGAVYKARQPNLDRLVALKILPPEAGNDPAFAERFTREARALARLNHPNIVAVYDFGERDGLYYFLMEYVDGTDIRKMIREGHIQADEALAVVPQICEALQYAHEEGIVHRDIKPENILVNKKGRVKIADFGLAKIIIGEGLSPTEKLFTLTGTHQVMGTIHYMAPEQIEHPLAVDHRADIYSLGVVFYEMLTGELPLGRFAPPSQRVRMDVRLDEVVLRSLEKEPEKRYQHAGDVKTDVETICGLPKQVAGRIYGYEYRSQTMLFGWPLVHIATGIDPATGRKRIAKGILAIGDVAIGGLAIGGFAMGGIAFGGVGFGLLTFAGLAIGLLAAIGGLAVGGFAFGGLAVGGIAIGGGAVGIFANGGSAWGLHVISGSVKDPQAVEFFERWDGLSIKSIGAAAMFLPLAFGLLWLVVWGVTWVVIRTQSKKNSAKQGRGSETGVSATSADDVVRRAVRAPGDGIIVTAILSIVPAVLIFLGDVIDLVPAGPLERLDDAGVSTFVISMFAIPSILAVPVGMLMIQGALRMQGLTSYRWARIGAILAMLPLTPAWLLGLPMGLWALHVLRKPKARAAFGQPPHPATSRSHTESAQPSKDSKLGTEPGVSATSADGDGRGRDANSPYKTLENAGFMLLLTGILYWLTIPAGYLMFRADVPDAAWWNLFIAPAIAGAVTIFGGLKLQRCEMYAACFLAAIVALLTPLVDLTLINLLINKIAVGPGDLLGLVAGMWALVVLTRPEVKAMFRHQRRLVEERYVEETGAQTTLSDVGTNSGEAKQKLIRQQTKGPAMGIACTGILMWVLLAVFVIYLSITEGAPHPAVYDQVIPIMSLAVASATFLIFGGLKMMNMQSYRMSIAASIVAIIVSPSNLIGLPIGVWALVVLTRQKVREAFET